MANKLYTETELKKKKLAELRELADEHDLDYDGWTKGDFVENLISIEAPEDDEEEDDEVDDTELDDTDEEELDDIEVDEVDDEEDDIDEAPAPKAKRAAKPKAEGEAKTPRAKREPKVDSEGKPTLPAKQVATYLKTEAKTLRQFLRSDASTFEAVGSGGRYEFTEADLPKIKQEFTAWREAHAARGSKRGPRGEKAAVAVETVTEVEEIEELDEDEPELEDEIDDEDLELDD